MIQQWWSRSSDDVQDGDPDRVMIQIQRWCSRDDPDPVMMIQIRWRWLIEEDDLKMKMTWRWRRPDDDPNDTEKKTCADKLCRENTFLVKRECWCICNFGMYSLVFLMYCNLMFISGYIVMCLSYVMPRCSDWEVSIMWTSHVKSRWVTLLLSKG